MGEAKTCGQCEHCQVHVGKIDGSKQHACDRLPPLWITDIRTRTKAILFGSVSPDEDASKCKCFKEKQT